MCGIVGIINGHPAAPELLGALASLEYRGYDSAGIATLASGSFQIRRAVGKLACLRDLVDAAPPRGTMGIAHTRWATHGGVTVENAHPHQSGRVVLVHNGIIENHRALRAALVARGRTLSSETDSEIVAHLIEEELERGLAPREALTAAVAHVEGSYALAVMFRDRPDALFATRKDSPLCVGWADDAAVLASDAMALGDHADRVLHLEDGEVARLRRGEVHVWDARGRAVTRQAEPMGTPETVSLGGFSTFMEKEIHEQPSALRRAAVRYVDPVTMQMRGLPPHALLAQVRHVRIVACGSSRHAGLAMKPALEELCGVPVTVEIASEARYRAYAGADTDLSVFISQSGETADTLAAMRMVAAHGRPTVALVNARHSSMAREATQCLLLDAGPEIGVASTKAHTSQMFVLACLGVGLARALGRLTPEAERGLCDELLGVPREVEQTLATNAQLAHIAEELVDARSALFMGRQSGWATALEGALKLKEISYIHAEGFAAGELKHGSIALIEPGTPVVAVLPDDALFAKSASNVAEVAARGARVIAVTDALHADVDAAHHVVVAPSSRLARPLVLAVPLQLLAFHTAVARGCDVDRPRNLAKSVTVE